MTEESVVPIIGPNRTAHTTMTADISHFPAGDHEELLSASCTESPPAWQQKDKIFLYF